MSEATLLPESEFDITACCANFYEQEWVQKLLGDSFHPGGIELSRRLVDQLQLVDGAKILDVACGAGTTAIDLSSRRDIDVVAIDYSAFLHRNSAKDFGASKPNFVRSDALSLAFVDNSFDAIICECAVSTFANKAQVAAEFSRILRPGGRLGISDMAVYGALPDQLSTLIGPWACVQDALTIDGYKDLFQAAGFVDSEHTDESKALNDLLLALKRKLLLAGLGQLAGVLKGLNLNVAELRSLIAQAKSMINSGRVQYGRMVFTKPVNDG